MPMIDPPRNAIGTIAGLFALLVSTLPGAAQQSPAQSKPAQQRPAQQAAPNADHELLTYFYKDPRPERLTGFLARFQETPVAEQPQAFPALTGFFAAVCIAHPDKFPRMVPADLKPKTAAAITAAVRLCGNERVAAALKQTLEKSPPDEQTKAGIASLPRLSDLRVTHPTHLDILWSASFVTGTPRHVAVITDFFAQVANQSETVAVDIAQATVEMMGGPKGTIAQLRGKYGDDGTRRLVYASSALWALQSNARQHVFVDQFVRKYIADNPGTPATKALTTMMPRGNKT